MEEKRKFFRFESPISLRYTSGNDTKKRISLTKNISREGAAFNVDKLIPQDENMNLEFEIPGDNVPVYAEALVMWIKKSDANKRRPFDVGVKLTNMARSDRGRILEYAYKQWLKIKKIKTKVNYA